MLEDRYGNPLTTASAAARDAYVRGVDASLSANVGAEEGFCEAIAADEGFALGHIALARTAQVYGRAADAMAPSGSPCTLASRTLMLFFTLA